MGIDDSAVIDGPDLRPVLGVAEEALGNVIEAIAADDGILLTGTFAGDLSPDLVGDGLERAGELAGFLFRSERRVSRKARDCRENNQRPFRVALPWPETHS